MVKCRKEKKGELRLKRGNAQMGESKRKRGLHVEKRKKKRDTPKRRAERSRDSHIIIIENSFDPSSFQILCLVLVMDLNMTNMIFFI